MIRLALIASGACAIGIGKYVIDNARSGLRTEPESRRRAFSYDIAIGGVMVAAGVTACVRACLP